jgi:hypothetical protein
MTTDARLRLLKLVARHFLRRNYCYEQVYSIIWFRNDDLGCNAQLVREVCRQALIEDNGERDKRWETVQ